MAEPFDTPASRGRVPAWLWPVLAVGLGLSVWFLNGGALFYYDSAAYVAQGGKMLGQLGFPASGGGPGAGGPVVEDGDNLINGSRSAIYALMTAVLLRLGGMSAIMLANVAVTMLSAWLTVRVLARAVRASHPMAALVGVPLMFAMAGSLPFYIAFVMPDILTPILLLMVALLAVFARQMRGWEIVLATALGAFAVVSHISHIPIAAALVPVVAVASLVGGRARWWLAPGLVVLMVLAGVAERQAFRVAAETVADAEVIYYPFLTARLIEDGPGWRYLNAKCPDAGLDTCALHEALSRSDDPYRLTASHIIFNKTEDLGSFQLMPPEDQARVAHEQYRFFVKVFLWAPVSSTGAIIRNTMQQAVMNDIKMTVPSEDILTNSARNFPELADAFHAGRLMTARAWLDALEPVHNVVYALSLVVVLWLMLMPGRLAGPLRGFAAVLLLGILANAFVTGAVSQPADRYGARVIWLLPWLAALLWMLRERRQDG